MTPNPFIIRRWSLTIASKIPYFEVFSPRKIRKIDIYLSRSPNIFKLGISTQDVILGIIPARTAKNLKGPLALKPRVIYIFLKTMTNSLTVRFNTKRSRINNLIYLGIIKALSRSMYFFSSGHLTLYGLENTKCQ